MITLSVDPHPGSHTVAALDPNGATLASITVSNTAEGLSQLHQFAVPFARRRWAIEGAGNHFVAVLVGQLLERSEIVYSVPPSLTSQYRARRGRKKNDGSGGAFLQSENDTVIISRLQPIGVFPLNLTIPIKSENTAAQIAHMLGVHPTQVGSWKKQALAGLPDVSAMAAHRSASSPTRKRTNCINRSAN